MAVISLMNYNKMNSTNIEAKQSGMLTKPLIGQYFAFYIENQLRISYIAQIPFL